MLRSRLRPHRERRLQRESASGSDKRQPQRMRTHAHAHAHRDPARRGRRGAASAAGSCAPGSGVISDKGPHASGGSWGGAGGSARAPAARPHARTSLSMSGTGRPAWKKGWCGADGEPPMSISSSGPCRRPGHGFPLFFFFSSFRPRDKCENTVWPTLRVHCKTVDRSEKDGGRVRLPGVSTPVCGDSVRSTPDASAR